MEKAIIKKLKEHDDHFVAIAKRFDTVDKRFEEVDSRFEHVDDQMDFLAQQSLDHTNRLEWLEENVATKTMLADTQAYLESKMVTKDEFQRMFDFMVKKFEKLEHEMTFMHRAVLRIEKIGNTNTKQIDNIKSFVGLV